MTKEIYGAGEGRRSGQPASAPSQGGRGRVVLVGGGPGADDLITVRGLDRLLAADVVITDRLAPAGLLARLGRHVEVIDAGRAPGRPTLTYDQIGTIMIDRALAGRTVVRLKGGDPFIFAHGAQEVQACMDAGIPVEVVPGVTAATAAPALAGVPLTHSGGAVGFTVVSGHLDPDDPACRVDWPSLTRSGTNLVILMGMRHLPAILACLMREGVAADAPAVCVADASLPAQRVVRAPLCGLAAAVTDAGLSNPATVVVEAGNRRAGRRVLVLGGSRSGKSAYAERLLAGEPTVTYVATARSEPDDPAWAERIERHRARRPAAWATAETTDVAKILGHRDGGALLIDSVTTWLTAIMDDCGCWAEEPMADSGQRLAGALDALVGAWTQAPVTAIAVSDEVGSGIVPATASGRAFRDALGSLNQRLAAAADEVWLVTAGIPRRLR
jgi:uroporphyrin-III C-methyltransferase